MPRSGYYLLFTVSGFAGLIYESIWTHYLKLYLGHAAYAQSLVLAVFMGGMAAGAAWCSRRSARIQRPLVAYAAVEAAIGLAALAFHPVFVALTDLSYSSVLPALRLDWLALGAKLALSAALILPQSFLLGATFPLMSAGLARSAPLAAGGSVSMLYFTNSLGASAGVLVSGFVLIDRAGLPGTLQVAGALNLAIALAVWLLARAYRPEALKEKKSGEARATLILVIAFFTGLASFAYEIGWIRMLSLVLGASTHSFELMLATFILGLALGGLAVRRRADAPRDPLGMLAWVQIAMGLAALATLPVYDLSFSLMETLMSGLARSDAGYALFNASGALVSALVMLPATFFAGMTLPLLTAALLRRGIGEAAIGRVYAANTLGAIAGVVLAVHAGLPHAGLKGTLIAASLVDVALGLVLLFLVARKALAPAVAVCACVFVVVAGLVKLDPNKMTAGVFRHGELAASRDAEILFEKDGKTATVHLVRYPEAISLRTNGKSDGSINMDADGQRGTDEVTMVLTAAIPLALLPEARSAAVIGIGTGLTSHTLLQSLALERVDTIEIEPAMAEAARGFMPRNRGAFVDPRSRIWYDDAKTFFSTRSSRYDIIISEPSNPWVSGVSGLFTREFYRRVRGHLNDGGLLVQWIQLYEIDASLVASVLRSLGQAFPHYAVFAPSDHDLLIVASERPLPLPAQARVFEEPGVAKELWTVHVLTTGDLDARFLGTRGTLEPLVESYDVAANSDYAPLLDLNAARHRFTEKSATDVVGMLNHGIPVLEMLDPARSRRAVNALFRGGYAFDRIENTRLAWYARNWMVNDRPPAPEAIPTQLQKDVELARLRLVDCNAPRDNDAWLHAAIRVAQAANPYLAPDDVLPVWGRIALAPCFRTLHDFQRRWIGLFRSVAARDAPNMAELARLLLGTQTELSADAREYLLVAGMTGAIASGKREAALELWRAHGERMRRPGAPVFRLLRCHADLQGCADAFRAYAER